MSVRGSELDRHACHPMSCVLNCRAYCVLCMHAGKSSKCDLKLDDEAASNLTARLRFENNAASIESCSPLGAVKLNNRSLARHEQVPLHSGDTVAFDCTAIGGSLVQSYVLERSKVPVVQAPSQSSRAQTPLFSPAATAAVTQSPKAAASAAGALADSLRKAVSVSAASDHLTKIANASSSSSSSNGMAGPDGSALPVLSSAGGAAKSAESAAAAAATSDEKQSIEQQQQAFSCANGHADGGSEDSFPRSRSDTLDSAQGGNSSVSNSAAMDVIVSSIADAAVSQSTDDLPRLTAEKSTANETDDKTSATVAQPAKAVDESNKEVAVSDAQQIAPVVTVTPAATSATEDTKADAAAAEAAAETKKAVAAQKAQVALYKCELLKALRDFR